MTGLRAPLKAERVDFEIAAKRGSRTWRALRRDPGFWVGALIAFVLIVLAIGATALSPYDPNRAIRGTGLTATGAPIGPTAEFPLGTDRLGRDYLSRLLHGARTSLTVGIAANLVSSLIGFVIGAVAGYAGTWNLSVIIRGRRVDTRIPAETLLMRLTDIVLSLPALLLAIALAAVLKASLMLVVLVVAFLLWPIMARVVYTRVRQVSALDYVDAARAVGASGFRILLRHIVPHVIPLVIVYASLGVAAAILFEATLSFLGVGVPPPAASWGLMISEHASYFRSDPRLLVLPGVAIMLTVLAFNLVGDALRDAIDPHL